MVPFDAAWNCFANTFPAKGQRWDWAFVVPQEDGTFKQGSPIAQGALLQLPPLCVLYCGTLHYIIF